jgi:hypothetical protein
VDINNFHIFHNLCQYNNIIDITEALNHKYSNNLILMFTGLQDLSLSFSGVLFSGLSSPPCTFMSGMAQTLELACILLLFTEKRCNETQWHCYISDAKGK